MVSALLPTPPAPTTTSLYSVMFVAAAHHTLAQFLQRKRREEKAAGPSGGLVPCMELSFVSNTSEVMRTMERDCACMCYERTVGANGETLEGECEKCAKVLNVPLLSGSA